MLDARVRLGRCMVVLLALVLLLTTVACGDSDEPARSTADRDKVTGNITVFAAASLTDAFTTLADQFEDAHQGTKVKLNFGASSALADQIEQGAPADVLATADTENMDKVLRSGDADKAQDFARNRLAILVGKGNPKHIETLGDLAKPDVAFVICAPEVPCGKFGARILAKAGVKAEPKSFEENVRAVVSRVTLGEADAGLVYVSDVKAAGSSKAEGVSIPDSQNTIATYPIAVLNGSANKVTARAFVASVRSAAGQDVLARADFLPVSRR